MTFSDVYNAYFEHQAINHPDLLHDPASGQRAFAIISLEEALGDFRSGAKAKGPIMRLIEYSYTASDFGAHEVRKRIEGGFIIAHYHSARAGGSDGYLDAMVASERIVDEIVEKMIGDSKAGHPLFYYSLSSRQDFTVNPTRFIGDACYSGYICLFSFSNYFRACPDGEGAPAWLDGGVTPHNLLG